LQSSCFSKANYGVLGFYALPSMVIRPDIGWDEKKVTRQLKALWRENFAWIESG